MFIKELQLFNFKNHTTCNYKLCNGINGFYGKNGVGKTNILDAIYMLSCAKSNFTQQDQSLIKHGQTFFSLHGWYNEENQLDILLKFDEQGKKSLFNNDKRYAKLQDHIGKIPVVFISPYDIELVLGLSDERRRFIDVSLCQTNTSYIQHLSLFKQLLNSRNYFLKKNEGQIIDPILMESIDVKLAPIMDEIFNYRKQFIEKLTLRTTEYYNFLTNSNELIGLHYTSSLLQQSAKTLLQNLMVTDVRAWRTTQGIHKDDIEITLNGTLLRKFGSQGQIKSAIIALKLAQYQHLFEETGKKPILLLDDIFEKIDDERAGKLMELISNEKFGQIIVSDTEKKRMAKHLQILNVTTEYFLVNNA